MSNAKKNVEKLSKTLNPFTEEPEAEAAVAVILKAVDEDLEILLVKRAENPTDPWSGQMAFPGGKRDSKDRNLKQTVIRETLEETGINLNQEGHFLGVLETQSSPRKPEIHVLPFIILLEQEPQIKLNKKELEWSTWISIEDLSKHEGTAQFSFGKFPAYILGTTVIWGLTYRIIEDLFHSLRSPT